MPHHPGLRTAAAALLSAAFLSPALAADAFTDAMVAAYGPYREALFRTNGQSQLESAQAIARAQQAWAEVLARFGQRAPAPYDRDPAFADSLGRVKAVYDTAAQEIAAGQLAQAHETLEAARDIQAELRQRNGVVVFSDHMNAYHLEMERALIDGPKWLQQDGHTLRLVAQAGVLAYLVARLREQAPASLKADADFERALAAVEASVNQLREAAQSQDLARTKAALGQVKAPYSRLFLRFG